MQKDYSAAYDSLEKNHWWWQIRRHFVFSEIRKLKFKPKQKKKDLLDIGCGPGVNIGYLKSKFNCIGIEPDKNLRAHAKKNTGINIKHGLLPNKLPKLEKKFDLVLLLDVLEHVKEDYDSLKTIQKQMKKGGYLVINVPAMKWLWSIHDEVNLHKRRYEFNELKTLLEKSGFEIIKIRYWGSLFAPMVWFERNVLQKNNSEDYSVPIPGKLVNAAFKIYAAIEYVLTNNFKLPFGLSLLAIVRKK